jgi:hypothetical protein
MAKNNQDDEQKKKILEALDGDFDVLTEEELEVIKDMFKDTGSKFSKEFEGWSSYMHKEKQRQKIVRLIQINDPSSVFPNLTKLWKRAGIDVNKLIYNVLQKQADLENMSIQAIKEQIIEAGKREYTSASRGKASNWLKK